MLLLATRSGGGDHRLEAIQRLGPPVKVGTRWVGLSGNPAAECGLGRRLVVDVFAEKASKVVFVQDDHVIE